jgi:glutaredoxin
MPLELYGTASCPYTEELREWLQWNRREFVEYDIESDVTARDRLRAIDNSLHTVPILIEGGKVIQVGWHGRGCVMGPGS